MAAPRLPFLYPNLMRAVRACEPTPYRSARLPRPVPYTFHATRHHNQEAYQRRYGPAVDPNLPPPSKPKGRKSAKSGEDAAASENEGAANATERKNTQPEQSQQAQSQDASAGPADAQPDPELVAADSTPSRSNPQPGDQLDENPATVDVGEDNWAAAPTPLHEAAASEEKPEPDPIPPPNQSAFEEVYHMPGPSASLFPTGSSPSDHNSSPHLTPGPYVHHFDTYSLVRDLSHGGFTTDHSITIMKAVRSILQRNLDLARESLTSKSDVENEEYLFKAACSELQSSLQTARGSEMQRQRASRTQLQHEIDILSQRLNQELSGMKDDIKGMFNDHSMLTREQQRSIDTSVQELNYKITVSLNSDGKSEIEGLRWVLTRRAALTVGICAFMIIVFLKYSSTRKVQEPAKVIKEVEKPVTKEGSESHPVHDAGVQTEGASLAELSESLG
ncbi:hypothetical protein N7510_005890 [Penicillium lagena]|uniref:uncharacterized protein n=1 Tax=Penicillium lagena TaxID=94218 RepID=UPI0025404E57|nr:uncharacterized protein N7510_005890 [Penicillium lagena]KAJ5612696.1 hypothetical protein N7510_005890 [Penicillium lagena]